MSVSKLLPCPEVERTTGWVGRLASQCRPRERRQVAAASSRPEKGKVAGKKGVRKVDRVVVRATGQVP